MAAGTADASAARDARIRAVIHVGYVALLVLATFAPLILRAEPKRFVRELPLFFLLLLLNVLCTEFSFSLGPDADADLGGLFGGAAVLTLGFHGVWVPLLSNLYWLLRKKDVEWRDVPVGARRAQYAMNLALIALPPLIGLFVYYDLLGGELPLADLGANLGPAAAFVLVEWVVLLLALFPLLILARAGLRGAAAWLKGVIAGFALTFFVPALFAPALAVILNRLGVGFFLFVAAGLLGIGFMAQRLAQLREEALARERLEKELALAREIQTSFLPESVPEVDGWQFAASLEPARHVSGDFYDFIPLPAGRLGLLVADVADKGMPAALYMALARTLIRAYAAEHAADAAACLLAANDRIVADTHSDLFVTVFYGVLDPADGSLAYCNAGHNPPYLCHGDGRPIEPLANTGMALGVLPGVSLGGERVALAPGDHLVLYTDGLTEAHNAAMEQFGSRRLLEYLASAASGQADKLHEGIRARVVDFVGSAPQFDDLTLMVVSRQE